MELRRPRCSLDNGDGDVVAPKYRLYHGFIVGVE